jgi:hypothetical protein
MATFLLKCTAIAATGSWLESKYVTANSDGPVGASSYAGLTPLLLIATGFWITAYGMNVASARKKAIEAAKKDGEQDVELRYGFPNLYAQGTSKHARIFNCVQRSHQHILESFTQVSIAALAGAVYFPICSAVATLLWLIGRVAFSNCYANKEGDPAKRYSSPFSRLIYYGMMILYLLGFFSCVNMIAGKKLLWGE